MKLQKVLAGNNETYFFLEFSWISFFKCCLQLLLASEFFVNVYRKYEHKKIKYLNFFSFKWHFIIWITCLAGLVLSATKMLFSIINSYKTFFIHILLGKSATRRSPAVLSLFHLYFESVLHRIPFAVSILLQLKTSTTISRILRPQLPLDSTQNLSAAWWFVF